MTKINGECDKCKQDCQGDYYETFKQFLCDDCLEDLCEDDE